MKQLNHGILGYFARIYGFPTIDEHRKIDPNYSIAPFDSFIVILGGGGFYMEGNRLISLGNDDAFIHVQIERGLEQELEGTFSSPALLFRERFMELRSPVLFDVNNHPEMNYGSKSEEFGKKFSLGF